MYLFDSPLAYFYVVPCEIPYVIDSLSVVDRLQMLTHGLTGDGHAFVNHEFRFLQGKRIAFYPVTLVGVLNALNLQYQN